jgi:hypothetical protein
MLWGLLCKPGGVSQCALPPVNAHRCAACADRGPFSACIAETGLQMARRHGVGARGCAGPPWGHPLPARPLKLRSCCEWQPHGGWACAPVPPPCKSLLGCIGHAQTAPSGWRCPRGPAVHPYRTAAQRFARLLHLNRCMPPPPPPVVTEPPALSRWDQVRLGLLVAALLGLLCTKVVRLGPEGDPIVDPSIDPENRQGLRCVGVRYLLCMAGRGGVGVWHRAWWRWRVRNRWWWWWWWWWWWCPHGPELWLAVGRPGPDPCPVSHHHTHTRGRVGCAHLSLRLPAWLLCCMCAC